MDEVGGRVRIKASTSRLLFLLRTNKLPVVECEAVKWTTVLSLLLSFKRDLSDSEILGVWTRYGDGVPSYSERHMDGLSVE